VAERHHDLTLDEVKRLNAHLAYEGARCCPTHREVYLLAWGICPACEAENERRAARERQRKADEKRAKLAARMPDAPVRPQHGPQGVSETKPVVPVGINIRRSPLWDTLKGQK